ncbi:MAG TPA: transglutaminase family protein [Beijerinckiaceae bacterium]|nr:transglutaminase family protein [Beijerinckiaceae bacterium]
MIYDIRHVTTYRYETPVAVTRCTLRLLPRSGSGQTATDSMLDVTPRPADMIERPDFFGNRVVTLRIASAYRELRIAALAHVVVERPQTPAPGLTPAWESVRREAAAALDLGADSPVHRLYPSRRIPLDAATTDYARASFPPRRPILEGAADLMRRIRKDFAYDPTATAVTTPLAEAFTKRCGVCQDFAHIMIAGLRGLGLPAGYVSGYIRTIPPPGQKRLEGADASHAWVSVWCGLEFGWLDLDPTNAIMVGDDHIVVAVGRDYADVSPIDGVFTGSGGHKLAVSVDVVPVR